MIHESRKERERKEGKKENNKIGHLRDRNSGAVIFRLWNV